VEATRGGHYSLARRESARLVEDQGPAGGRGLLIAELGKSTCEAEAEEKDQ
jgi:hypothetical protein